MTRPITVYQFYDAPAYLRAMSECGGDEDWLAVVPPELADAYIPWLELPHFDCCSVDRYDHPRRPGWKIVIGAHA